MQLSNQSLHLHLLRYRLGKYAIRILMYASAALVVLETIAPLAWMFISSISEGRELLSMPPRWLPERPTLERYESLFITGRVSLLGATTSSPAGTMLRGLYNSLLIAGVTTAVCLMFGLLTSYATARFRFVGRQAFLFGILALQMLPAIATVIPLFFIFRMIGLVDSPLSLIITYSGFTITYIVWVMTGYIRSLPIELEEAALIDGATRLGAFLRITAPLALPGIVAVGILSFLTAWNEFLFALILSHSLGSKTLPVIISEFSTQFGLDYGMIMTGGVIASLPPVLLALFFQRYLVQGLTAGSVKG
ncbi:MAG: carbohydrate ABC transporter permease [Anaerolineae bacterium]|nr:carbohydrate ABC transporter permease [Candidatus Roseilinea sp.]MDW8450074.1 carbohydrate ABC transporter permease [Anaerolineae bacterium]